MILIDKRLTNSTLFPPQQSYADKVNVGIVSNGGNSVMSCGALYDSRLNHLLSVDVLSQSEHIQCLDLTTNVRTSAMIPGKPNPSSIQSTNETYYNIVTMALDVALIYWDRISPNATFIKNLCTIPGDPNQTHLHYNLVAGSDEMYFGTMDTRVCADNYTGTAAFYSYKSGYLQEMIGGLKVCGGIAKNSTNGTLYFADTCGNKILQYNLDVCGVYSK